MARIVAIAHSVLLASPSIGAAQESRRGVPRAVREALVGCWVVDGETHVLTARGASGLAHRWRAVGEHGATETYGDTASWFPARRTVQVGCGARTQHGQHCELEVGTAGVTFRRIARRHGGAHRIAGEGTARACTDADPRPTDAPEREVRAIAADAPASALLGARRRDVDGGRTPTGEQNGWTLYGEALAIRYEHGLAMRVRVAVGAVSCEDAARAAGYVPLEGSAPLRRHDGCEWPGRSGRHRLAAHVAGRFADGVLEVWMER